MLRLPTSTTWNSSFSRRSSACRRLTVTSSRKMSLPGCRPTDVTGRSSRNWDPALGPRFTTTSAEPGGSPSTGDRAVGPHVGRASGSLRKLARGNAEVVSIVTSSDVWSWSLSVTPAAPFRAPRSIRVRIRPGGVDLDQCRANGHPSSPIGFRTHAVVFTFAGVRMPRHHDAPASPCRHRWRPSLFPASGNLCVPASCKIPASCRRRIGRRTGCCRYSIHIGESPRALKVKSPWLQYHSLIHRREINSVLRLFHTFNRETLCHAGKSTITSHRQL